MTLALATALINKPSITPDDLGCQALIMARLQRCGFHCEALQFGQVTNLWATRGNSKPILAFAGHTDVVPPGPLAKWTSDPFIAVERDGYLFGRGAVDMKGGLAAMITAIERFVANHPNHLGTIAVLLTSDEEDARTFEGTPAVMNVLQERGIFIDYCVLGEPTSEGALGTIIKNGRRGSLNGYITFHGQQGHIAYPDKAHNPIPKAMAASLALVQAHWDEGNAYFQPTQLQISNFNAGTGASNVIPGHVDVHFNLRYSTALTADAIQSKVTAILDEFAIEYDLTWHHSGEPYLTAEGELLLATQRAVETVTGIKPLVTTSGGTSDGRFIALSGTQVVECGLDNSTAHKVNECVKVQDLLQISNIYENILQQLLL